MPILVFPTIDALRIAISSGVVPAPVANAPAQGAVVEGAAWLDTPDLPREVLGPLAKLGVTRRGAGPELLPLLRWAELIPCRDGSRDSAAHVLLNLPAGSLAAVWDAARRVGKPLDCLGLQGQRGWLHGVASESVLGLCTESGGQVFTEQAQGVWVERGAGHPLTAQLAGQTPEIVIPRGGAWGVAPTRSGQVILPAKPAVEIRLPRPPRFHARQRLLRASAWEDASVYLVDAPGRDALRAWLATTPEAALAPLRVARLSAEGRERLLFAGPRGSGFTVPFADAVGYCPHPKLATLLIPRGFKLSPVTRAEVLTRLFGLGRREFGLVGFENGRVTCTRLPVGAFRPASRLARYQVPTAVALTEPTEEHSRLALPRFVAVAESSTQLQPAVVPEAKPRPVVKKRSRSWLGQLLPTRQTKPLKPAATESIPTPPGRVLEKLASPQALAIGGEWLTRRAGLERRVLAELPRADALRRVQLWAELGEVYVAIGHPADAAVALLNAAWGDPGLDAAQAWLTAERRLARLHSLGGADALVALAAPKPCAARLACATLTHAAALPSPPAETLTHLPELARLIDPALPDLPARAAWLGYQALDRLSGGDALALARGRDGLFERLAATGPSLDVDAPSFLRFRGVSGERHAAARDWTARVREPLHRWLGKLGTPGRLQWAGLDGDPTGTTAYADLMLAWGLAKLGDRARAAELQASAAAALTAETPPGADPRVPKLLLDAFRHRARTAADGRTDLPGLPPELHARLAALDELGRYAVDKLRAASAILEPGELVDPYGGRGVAAFLGADALGERLGRFLAAREWLPGVADARELLALGPADPTATTMPRIIFALLEASPRLDASLVAALIPQTIRAVELIPEWLRRSAPMSDPAPLAARIGKRMIESACHAAATFQLPESFGEMTEDLVRHADDPDGSGARLVESVAGLMFRTLRRLRLIPLAGLLLNRLRPGTPIGARELGLSVGLFAVGNEEAGNRVLDAARDRLLVRGIADDNERTAVAVAYATALGDAPPRIALGRLEELFQRLEMVSTAGTANRYYTLHPLRLVDASVRAAVGDEFAVGPGVRAWLADEEFITRSRVAADLAGALRRG